MKRLIPFVLFFFTLLLNYGIYAQVSSPEAPENLDLLKPDFEDLRLTGSEAVQNIIAPNLINTSDGRVFRLIGLNFPDFDHEEPGELALLTMDILKEMLTGKRITIYQTKKDDWGRTNRMGHNLAHIALDDNGRWVQGTLLALGLARVQPQQRNPEMTEEMLTLEERARKSQIGLWEKPEFAILQAEDLNTWHQNPEDHASQLYKFQVADGVIKAAAFKGNRYYMNFGDDWRTDFTVSIAPENRRLFQKNGMDPLQWQGKRVRMRGILDMYNGALIEITHPAQIEFLDN